MLGFLSDTSHTKVPVILIWFAETVTAWVVALLIPGAFTFSPFLLYKDHLYVSLLESTKP